MDPEKCWEEVDTIISVMDSAINYLSTEEISGQQSKKQQATFQDNDIIYDDIQLDDDEKALVVQRKVLEKKQTLRKK